MSARIWPSPGVSISSASAATGSSPIVSGSPRTRLCQRPSCDAAAAAGRAGRVALPGGGAREHRAAGPVEVAGEHVQHVDEPGGERAELLRRGADAAVDRGRSAAASSRASRRIASAAIPRDRRDRLGRERRGELLDAVDPVDQLREPAGAREALLEEHVDQREQQERVGAGPDRDVLVGDLGGAAAARVDDDEPAAARAQRLQAPGQSGAVISQPFEASGLAPSISR